MENFAEQNARERLYEAIQQILDEAEDSGMDVTSTDELAEMITGQVWSTLRDMDPEDLGFEVNEEEN